MSQKNAVAPRIPAVPELYDAVAFNGIFRVISLYFNQLDNKGPIAISTQRNGTDVVAALSAPPTGTSTGPSLPTQADLANLRVGDIYYDTTAGNVLKVKT
jgi:hypothetical protein